MIKVIKTNLSINSNNNKIIDHQSYIEQEESWEAFVEKVKDGRLFSKTQQDKVENLKYDNFHLSCDIWNSHGMQTKHLAYIEGRVIIQ